MTESVVDKKSNCLVSLLPAMKKVAFQAIAFAMVRIFVRGSLPVTTTF